MSDSPAEQRVYTSQERSSYVGPPCDDCGTRLAPMWADAGSLADPHRGWYLARLNCPNAVKHPQP